MSYFAGITQRIFGITPEGKPVTEYHLRNARGTSVKVLDWGGTVTEFLAHDKRGNVGNIVLGFESLEPYLKNQPFFGALVGRVGNRIANAGFVLDGVKYVLAANNGTNNLHAGPEGFEKKLWSATAFENTLGPGLELTLYSEDGDQGFPGNVSVKVIYQLTYANEWVTDIVATTDKATPFNMTQHSYFNLAGSGDILKHKLQIFADHYAPLNAAQIPLGHIEPVSNTPFDFRVPYNIGERIGADDSQLKIGNGYDHYYVIAQPEYKEMTLAARVEEESSGRVLELFTQEPGVQFYSGNFLNETYTNKERVFYARTGFCLEPQHYPDSPNQPQFPSIILRPGEEYKTRSLFRISVKDESHNNHQA